ncbi:MAG: D-cysteine desulfhydrase family protein [Proteobacteria bacterium]|nr:D-cysteine desulfhydrase family protein [Pseudomonadota bacterium]
MIEFPNRLHLARLPTPITRLQRFPLTGSATQIWIKRDELTGTEVSGNKIRKLEFSLAEAQEQGCDTVITCGGLQSNHCRSTAILCTRLGLQVHLVLRGEKPEQPEGNLLMDYLSGAEITYVSQHDWHGHEELVKDLQQDYATAGSKAFYIPIGASDEIGLWGYIAACEELKQDFQSLDMTPDYIVTATGSGGTQGGLIVGIRVFEIPTKVLAFNVCDDAAYFDQKIRRDVTLWQQRYKTDFDVKKLAITTVEGYMGAGYGTASEAVFASIALLARTDGLFLDPVYTGKAFHGMVSEIQKGDDGALPGARNVLFIHTGGLFGVFPQQQNFLFK